MPGASTTYDPAPVPLDRVSDLMVVFRYDPEQADPAGKWEALPNVRCLGVAAREGADPGSARFRYVFGDPLGGPDDPQRFEQVYPLGASGPRVVNGDDQVVVCALHEDGSHTLLFWGFVQVPQLDLGPEAEDVSFVALGAAVREWDRPLQGAYVRDADSPLIVSDTQTDLPARFNPDGRPNATPESGDAGEEPATYPTFLGPFWPGNKVNGENVRLWTLAMAARYVVVRGALSPASNSPSKYVTYDDLSYLDSLLTAVRPAGDGDDGVVDEDDDATFTIEDIEAPDADVTGQCWPEALWRLIEPYGFGMCFDLEEQEAEDQDYPGDPKLTLRVYWKDGDRPGKALSLQEAGAALDPGRTNLQGLALARDTAGLANRIAVDAAPVVVETGFVLAPGYQPAAADASSLDQFRRGNALFTGDARDRYRLYVLDECGEGHWDYRQGGALGSWVNDAPDLGPAFLLGKKERYWANRRRAPLPRLVSVDARGEPLAPALLVSFDYSGPAPGVYDGAGGGHWEVVTAGTWRVLDDRVGVYLTADDVNAWKYHEPDAETNALFCDPKLNVVERATSLAGQPVFMLVCAVATDNDFDVVAPKRPASPTRFAVTRRVDARDRFKKTIINKFSWFADVNNFARDDEVVTDDTDDAKALADGQRRHGEAGVFAGAATVPRLTTAYRLGDKITRVDGRDVSLRSNVGAEQGESPVYPAVVGVAWNFDGAQQTTLTLSDARAEPPPRRGKRREE